MKRGSYILAALLALFVLSSAVVPSAFAEGSKPPAGECGEFYLLAVHGINGKRLGLEESNLPVDVYVNGGYAFTFEFKDAVGPVALPAGNYKITVNLAGTDQEVMSLGPVDIPGCVKVRVVAKLVDGIPTLLPKITELPSKKF